MIVIPIVKVDFVSGRHQLRIHDDRRVAIRYMRMLKVKQKVSGRFRSSRYAEACCRISNCLQTMANQAYKPLLAIQLAISGHIYYDAEE